MRKPKKAYAENNCSATQNRGLTPSLITAAKPFAATCFHVTFDKLMAFHF
jgi:hypothetical protein